MGKPLTSLPAANSLSGISDQRKKKSKSTATTLEDVFAALDWSGLHPPTSICTGDVATSLPSVPGLIVKGVGQAPLPLNSLSLSLLKSAQRKATTSGEKNGTSAASSNIIQINADQLCLKNPTWNTGLRTLVDTVSTNTFNVDPQLVQPHLEKLLVLEKGGAWNADTDNKSDREKVGGREVFATLVVQLPSVFQGGYWVISSGDEEEEDFKPKAFRMDSPDSAPFNCRYLCYHKDCDYRTLPIESGHQVVLIYSLCYHHPGNKHNLEAMPPHGCDLDLPSPLAKAIELLPVYSGGPFAIPLLHQGYKSAALARLGFKALQPLDGALAKTIQRAKGWKVLVAQLTAPLVDTGNNDKPQEPSIQDLYHLNGADAKAHEKWLVGQLNFRFVGESSRATLLASKEQKESLTNATWLLVTFRESYGFSNVCRYNFSDAVDEVVMDPSILPLLEDAFEQFKPTLSHDDFFKLHQILLPNLHGLPNTMTMTDKPLADDAYWAELNQLMNVPSSATEKEKFEESYWQKFTLLFDRLTKDEPPTPAVASIFESLLHRFDCSDKTEPIRLLLDKLQQKDVTQPSPRKKKRFSFE